MLIQKYCLSHSSLFKGVWVDLKTPVDYENAVKRLEEFKTLDPTTKYRLVHVIND